MKHWKKQIIKNRIFDLFTFDEFEKIEDAILKEIKNVRQFLDGLKKTKEN